MLAGLSSLWGVPTVLIVVGVLAVVLRWTYGSSFRSTPPPPTTGDFGLLREVTTVASQGEANALRAILGDAGIRSTSVRGPHDTAIVMVFEADLERARRAAGPR
jgi:hypothetical protein